MLKKFKEFYKRNRVYSILMLISLVCIVSILVGVIVYFIGQTSKDKYGNRLDDDFVLGYYIHLYTDYLWFKYFVPDFCENGSLYKLDGTKEFVDDDKKLYYFYNDYTNLNIKLIDE